LVLDDQFMEPVQIAVVQAHPQRARSCLANQHCAIDAESSTAPGPL
jgi:hypothetical protein